MELENTWSSLCVWVVCLAVLFSWLEDLYISSFILELYISSFIMRKILKAKTSFNLCSAVPLSKDVVFCFQNKKLLFS